MHFLSPLPVAFDRKLVSGNKVIVYKMLVLGRRPYILSTIVLPLGFTFPILLDTFHIWYSIPWEGKDIKCKDSPVMNKYPLPANAIEVKGYQSIQDIQCP